MRSDFRVLAFVFRDDVSFRIHEVTYDADGDPKLYDRSPVTLLSLSIEELEEWPTKIKEAIKKPIIYAGDKFPKKYK